MGEMGGGRAGGRQTERDRQTDMAAQTQTERQRTPNEKEALYGKKIHISEMHGAWFICHSLSDE